VIFPKIAQLEINYRKQSLVETTYTDIMDTLLFPLYPKIVEIFGSSKSFMLLLRPDNYIGFLSGVKSLVQIENYFRGYLSLN